MYAMVLLTLFRFFMLALAVLCENSTRCLMNVAEPCEWGGGGGMRSGNVINYISSALNG